MAGVARDVALVTMRGVLCFWRWVAPSLLLLQPNLLHWVRCGPQFCWRGKGTELDVVLLPNGSWLISSPVLSSVPYATFWPPFTATLAVFCPKPQRILHWKMFWRAESSDIKASNEINCHLFCVIRSPQSSWEGRRAQPRTPFNWEYLF